MIRRPLFVTLAVIALVVLAIGPVDDAAAERGGFSRSGPAAGGSFSSRASLHGGARTASRQQHQIQSTERTQARTDTRNNRQDNITERQGQRQEGYTERTEIRQQGYTERQENRQDFARDMDWDDCCDDDRDEFWGGVAVGAAVGVAVGAAATRPGYITTLPCTPYVVVAGGYNYYRCGTTWYSRSYVGSSVTYIVVNPPPGY